MKMAFAAAFLVILLAAPCVFAVDYPVSWTLGPNYGSWANRSFNVNDTLTFTYTAGTHTVDVVTRSNFGSCNSANPISTDRSGRTIITLTEGTNYIICGITGHCSGGMALQATARASGSSGTTPSPSGTPAPSGSGSGSGSGTGSSAPPPSGGNGAAGLSSATPFVFGFPLVLGTLFAFMG